MRYFFVIFALCWSWSLLHSFAYRTRTTTVHIKNHNRNVRLEMSMLNNEKTKTKSAYTFPDSLKRIVVPSLSSIALATMLGALPALAAPNFIFGSNVGGAVNAYLNDPVSLTCTLDNQNIRDDQDSCQQHDQVVRIRAGRLLTINQDWGGSVSTGASIWNGENVAVWYMENVLGRKELQGKRVIELGSGVGFSGIVSSILGASEVVITDGNEDVLKLADTNIQNNVQNVNEGSSKSPIIRTQRLRWNTEDESAFLAGSDRGEWDFVLASDVTYLKKNWADLVHTIKVLSGPHTRAILSMEPRNVGEVEGVRAEVLKAGLEWKEEKLPNNLRDESVCSLSCARLFTITNPNKI